MERTAIRTSSIPCSGRPYSLPSRVYQFQLDFAQFLLTNLARTGHRYEVAELVQQNKKRYFLDNFFESMLRGNSNVVSHRVLHSAILVSSVYHDLPKNKGQITSYEVKKGQL